MNANWWDSFEAKPKEEEDSSTASKALPHAYTGLIVVLLNAALTYFMSAQFQDTTLTKVDQNKTTIENVKADQTEKHDINQEKIQNLEKNVKDLQDFIENLKKNQQNLPKDSETPKKTGIFSPE